MNPDSASFSKDSQTVHKVVHKDGYDYPHVEASDRYTVFMTKGTHIVSREMVQRIIDAMEHRQQYVDITVDIYGNGAKTMDMALVIAHVVSWMKHDDAEDVDYANVTFLRR